MIEVRAAASEDVSAIAEIMYAAGRAHFGTSFPTSSSTQWTLRNASRSSMKW